MILRNVITFNINLSNNLLEFSVADARRASQVCGARRRTSAVPEVCITGVGHPFPASWDSLPRTTASDNRAGPFLTMSRSFSTLAVHYGVGTYETQS